MRISFLTLRADRDEVVDWKSIPETVATEVFAKKVLGKVSAEN